MKTSECKTVVLKRGILSLYDREDHGEAVYSTMEVHSIEARNDGEREWVTIVFRQLKRGEPKG